MHVNIRIDSTGRIKCDPQGGHLVANGNEQVNFIGDGVQFTLLFRDYRTGAPAWPFRDPPAAPPPTAWPQGDFVGICTNDPGAPSCFKYTIQVAGHPDLDPIIIVNK